MLTQKGERLSFGVCVFCLCFIITESFDLFHFVFVVLYGGVISEILFMCVDSIAS